MHPSAAMNRPSDTRENLRPDLAPGALLSETSATANNPKESDTPFR